MSGTVLAWRDDAARVSDEAAREGRSVYVVVNGALGMSAGKVAAQAFQAAQRLLDHAAHPAAGSAFDAALAEWRELGTRTIVLVAETRAVFERVCREVAGVVMVDEGVNEVEPETATVFASMPMRRDERPAALRHKRVRLLRG